MICRDDLPPTPDWTFTPAEVHDTASLPMPRLWQDDSDQA